MSKYPKLAKLSSDYQISDYLSKFSDKGSLHPIKEHYSSHKSNKTKLITYNHHPHEVIVSLENNEKHIRSRLYRQECFDYGSTASTNESGLANKKKSFPIFYNQGDVSGALSMYFPKNATTFSKDSEDFTENSQVLSQKLTENSFGTLNVNKTNSIDINQIGSLSRYQYNYEPNERIRINVSGQIFEITSKVLSRHPNTLLGNQFKWCKFYDKTRNELFFDRHRPSFEAIFFYYQFGGMIRRPFHVPNEIFLDELLFYQLEDNIVEEYKRSEGYTIENIKLPTNPTMLYIWRLFEYPETSKFAFAIAVLSVLMTVLSIVLFCVETLPAFSQSHCEADEAPNFLDPFFVIETTCTFWFTVELLFRFFASPDKFEFWKDFKNLVDVTAVVPYYVTLSNVLSTMSCASAKSSASLSFLRVIRLVRIFKLTKHSVGLQILLMTFRASLEGLGLFLVALVVSLLVFSSAIYYAELENPKSQMYSIPDAFWWAIITMTTVGYGDKVPVGPVGKLIGAACAITGVLTLAIPVPIITGHFNRFYSHKTGRGRHV